MSLRRILSLLFLCLPQTVWAATYTVDRTDDAAAATTCSDSTANDCSLRGAVIKANTDAATDTVVIPAGTYTLTLPIGGEAAGNGGDTATSGDLDVDNSLIITGAGADLTTINATATGDRAINVHSTGSFAISGVTITGGNSGFRGGGLWAFSVTAVTISDCVFSGNDADDGAGSGDGGALSTDGSTATVSNSTFSGNTAGSRGGAIFHETNTLTIINSTFSGNSTAAASVGAGAIDVPTGSLVLISSTIVGNTVNNAAGDGGGIRNTTVGTVTIKNSILANNSVGAADENCGGDKAYTSGGHNVSDDASCAFAGTGDLNSATGTIVNATLADNGGTAPTHTLVTSSPAIDLVPSASCLNASSAALTVDQRGFARPLTATGATTSCDAGAVEVGCGNQVVEAAETCDEAGASTATCDSDCTAPACGDGVLNTAAGEECEDSNTTAGDGCSATCATEAGTTVVCGNGIIQGSEACDDGNATSGDGCSATCTTETEELTTDNPTVDFYTLTIGTAVSLVAPSPSAVANLNALVLDVAADEDTCDCTWSVDPTTIGTFADTATCNTSLTPDEAGDGTLSVAVDCGADGEGTFTQSLTVASAASSGGGSGCSLQPHAEGSDAPRTLILGVLFSLCLLATVMYRRVLFHAPNKRSS